jgi:hypothetical protein
VYDDDWRYKNDIIKQDILRIINPTSIPEINIFETSNLISNLFHENNNLYGSVNSDINISSSIDNNIISLISIKKYKNKKFEIVKMTGDDTFDRLFYYFVQKYKPLEVSGIVNKDWNIYDFYEKNKFQNLAF